VVLQRQEARLDDVRGGAIGLVAEDGSDRVAGRVVNEALGPVVEVAVAIPVHVVTVDRKPLPVVALHELEADAGR
jgi:hypothetical protein